MLRAQYKNISILFSGRNMFNVFFLFNLLVVQKSGKLCLLL